MKNTISTLTILLIFSTFIHAQSMEASWKSEQKYRKTGMTVLGTWAAANIGVGLIARSQTTGAERYFHEMNAIWNTVNLGIAASSYFSAHKMQQPESALALYQYQNQLDKILLFNAGVDFAYIATGVYLVERSKREPQNQSRLKGYGNSVILQGAFLLVFDLTMVLVHKQFLVGDDAILSFHAGPGLFGAALAF